MSAKTEENHLFLSSLLGLPGRTDGSGNGMTALRSRNDALGAGKKHTRLEGLKLRNVNTVHVAVADELGDDHARTVVAQSAGVDVSWFEVVPQGVHGQQRRVAGLVTEVILELAAGEFGTA